MLRDIQDMADSSQGKQNVSDSDEDSSEHATAKPTRHSEAGIRRVTINAIMESWPLQLRVLDGDAQWTVELRDVAVTEDDGEVRSVADLKPGQEVELQTAVGDDAAVSRIRILRRSAGHGDGQ